MREIKFRTWDKKEKRMIVFGLFDTDRGYNDFTKMPVMQYTGLKDRHEKDIYDGDILKYNPFDNYDVDLEIKYVCQSKRYAGFCFISPKEDEAEHCRYYMNLLGFCNMKEWVIIGNIYQNPKLLTRE